MKTRNGFVSNSSSSSFVLIGNSVSVENLDINSLKEGEIYVGMGYDGFEYGTGLFEFNREMIDYVKQVLNSEDEKDQSIKEFFYDMRFIKSVYSNYECSGNDFKIPQGDYKIWSGECDQHSIESLSELKEFFEYWR